MANTNKSTKAKTKTSKAKAPKKTNTISGAKTSSKSTTNKSNKNDSSTKKLNSSKSKNTLYSKMTALQKLYASSIVVYLAITAAAIFLMNSVSYQLSVGYWGKDELRSVNGTQFAPATQGIFDIQIKWIVIAIALLSLIIPFLYLTKLKSYNAKSLKERIMLTRWIDMAIIGAIMIETIALLSGVLDLATLKLIGGFMIVTMILGWFAEKRTIKEGKGAIREYYLGVICGFMPWLIIFSYAIFTYIYGTLRMPWFVYALYLIMLIGASLLGKLQLSALKGEKGTENYETVERKYFTYTLVLRLIFSVVLIVGFLSK